MALWFLDSKMASMRRGGASGGAGNMAGQGGSAGGAGAPPGPGQVVIADPNRLVPVQITIPAQVKHLIFISLCYATHNFMNINFS